MSSICTHLYSTVLYPFAERFEIAMAEFQGADLKAMGSGEDTHGIASGCISPAAPNSTGCPTCFPAGPNTGAAFDRELWAAIGETIGREGRALNNLQSAPLYFFDPDMNLMRDPRCALLSSCTKQPQHLEPPSIIVYGTA